ncbi:hypothetical protein ANCCEY_07636 [Ancylostoma ceylanicum]|uniref:5' nucleotidase family protein n=1 Tax=Ancylostoma ceylanicum TaxID=53326 RepID=A0A0D6LTA4_9BILA|nr:hypothetical protein ANCCEY_07636 [Ancylostoma ceylanicum]
MGLAGKDILYVGDHIFGDVLKSKKVGGWRTLLIVPELDNEMKIWSSQLMKFNGLLELNNSLSDFQTIQQSAIRKKILKEITLKSEHDERPREEGGRKEFGEVTLALEMR